MTITDAQRYPLAWPAGWKRTPYHQRRHAAFHMTKTVYGSPQADGSRSSRDRALEALEIHT